VVRSGQVVARVESDLEAARVALNKAQAESDVAVRAEEVRVQFQESRHERNKALYERKVITNNDWEQIEAETMLARLDLDRARFDRTIARLELEQAQTALERKIIRSPIDGVIVERKLSPGEYVSDQTHIMTIAQIDPLHVEVFMPIERYPLLEIGRIGAVELPEPISQTYFATVTVIDHMFDAASGTFGARLELPNPDRAIPTGIKCRVSFPGATEP
jgi:RND family efflux transporter MFP subunit